MLALGLALWGFFFLSLKVITQDSICTLSALFPSASSNALLHDKKEQTHTCSAHLTLLVLSVKYQ